MRAPEPGINAFHRAAKLDGAQIGERYIAALRNPPEIEQRALIAASEAWGETHDFDEEDHMARWSFAHSPVVGAVAALWAPAPATATGGIMVH